MTLAQMTPPFISTLALPESAGTLPAWPPTGRQIADKPAGGFFKCPADFLTLPWGLYRDGHLEFLGLRTWYALMELPERRCGCTDDQDVHYSVNELCQLLHVPRRAPVQAALRSLEDVGLVAWSGSVIHYLPEPAALRERALPGYQALQAQIPAWRTWVPVPRRLVRWLAREGTPGLCATAAGVVLRCLWSRKRQCVSGGRVAASWIAKGFGLAERTVQRALDGLQACGWLARLPSTNAADAVAERRYGARTVVNLGWDVPDALEPEAAAETTALDKARRKKSRPARREVSVEHCVKHSATLDQNLSPTPAHFHQNLSPTPPAVMPKTPAKSSGCGAPSGSDFYPLQEQRPDPVPAPRVRELPTGFCHNEQDEDTTTANPLLLPPLPALRSSSPPLVEDDLPTAPTSEALLSTSLPTPPASANPALLEDPAVAFAALPPAEQDELFQAATAHLLAQGWRPSLLCKSMLLAEVYGQMAPASRPSPPGETRLEAPVVASPVSALPHQAPHAPVAAPLSIPAACPRGARLGDPAAVCAALALAEQDERRAAVTVRRVRPGLRPDMPVRPMLLAEVSTELVPPPLAAPAPSTSRSVALAKAPAASPPPSLSDVVPADLRDVARLEALRQQAIRHGWLTGCDADRLNFIAAAVHARRIGATPCALFVAVVRDQRWEVITDGDEDEARALLRERDAGPARPAAAALARGLSDDACVVRFVQQTLRQAGSDADPFVIVAQRDAAWTRARWDVALAELHGLSGRPGLERLGEVLGEED